MKRISQIDAPIWFRVSNRVIECAGNVNDAIAYRANDLIRVYAHVADRVYVRVHIRVWSPVVSSIQNRVDR